MYILIADPDKESLRKVGEKLTLIGGITSISGATDLTTAFNLVERHPPSVVILEERLTKQTGFEMMEALLRCLSVRWLVYNSNGPQQSCQMAPNMTLPGRFLDPDADLGAILSKLKGNTDPSNKPISFAQSGLFQTHQKYRMGRLVLIGASTGGIDALLQVLGSFPMDCPPTLVVQHTGTSFSAGLARMLNQRVEPIVREAINGEVPKQGTVLIAPTIDKHLVLNLENGIKCQLVSKPTIGGHRPSVDALFQSAEPLGSLAIGVILTGMGKDGGAGLLKMKNSGALTIGQDKATSVVFGMPGYAAKIGAVTNTLPIQSIGQSILRAQRQVRII